MKLEGMLVQAGDRDERERVIDDNLKRVYEETLEEGIPDRFKELLNQLKQQEADRGPEK
ncbi:NepR family anti-sigma factor [Sulfitobacter aestuarii]|uniref:NepR family anti-sigma factor n=1 Tax=Sulfitobacter aestuarii TaxID=2161676 RepID=A0ABW5U9V2_9RHOB